MIDLVRRQLTQSIATMQAVLDDASIAETLVVVGHQIAESMRNGGKLLVAGNGGSAADAQHLVAEFVVRLTVNRPALRAIALTVDSSILTACGNDFGFDQVFARQIEALAQPGDVFLCITTSGNSPNILNALTQCKKQGVLTVGLTGNGGGKMAAHCDHNLIIPSSTTMNIQESHLALEHILCMIVERSIFGMDFDKAPQLLTE